MMREELSRSLGAVLSSSMSSVFAIGSDADLSIVGFSYKFCTSRTSKGLWHPSFGGSDM